MENTEIRKLIIDLKTQESILGSLGLKAVESRAKIKKEIARIQNEINKLRKEKGTPLNKPERLK